ncbi:hypothetical protein Anas_10799 [Armadillidium nasatum]|uniref:Uncharacterized protein n=1 Tax=Armadillidium nasatum TaxID=96803 RepID=A0A5N5T330_9CRUS|nr:hypothetical protein Anas_10799 [Armadillidium nasatum]
MLAAHICDGITSYISIINYLFLSMASFHDIINTLGEKVMSYATSHQYGEINIISGKLTKDSYPSDITNKISALNFISSESGDVIVCFLISCEIVLYNKTHDKCFIIKGPPDLKNCKFYVSTKKSFNPIQKFNTFIKKYNNREGIEPAKEASSESPEETVHVAEETCYKPKIFASSNLSKIFLIFNNKKVFFYSEQQNAFKTSDDPWKLFEMPQEATPSQKDREICIDVSFINTLGGSFSCISFCFFRDEQLNIASLLLQENCNKYGTKTNYEWMRKIVNLGYNIKRKNSLLLKISPNDLTFCVVINTYENSFQLLYGHINRESVAVVDCPYPVKDLEANNRFQWVNCIDWIAKSNFIIGCLRSGYIFISSRFGRLLKIEWSCSSLSDSIAGYFINIFPEFNISKRNITKEKDESESDATTKTSSSAKPKFSFLATPSSTRIAICSGFGICLFTLPENILRQVTCICLVIHNKNEMISLYNISFLKL